MGILLLWDQPLHLDWPTIDIGFQLSINQEQEQMTSVPYYSQGEGKVPVHGVHSPISGPGDGEAGEGEEP